MTQTQTLLEAIDEVEENVNELREQVEAGSLFSDEDDDDTVYLHLKTGIESTGAYAPIDEVTVEVDQFGEKFAYWDTKVNKGWESEPDEPGNFGWRFSKSEVITEAER